MARNTTQIQCEFANWLSQMCMKSSFINQNGYFGSCRFCVWRIYDAINLIGFWEPRLTSLMSFAMYNESVVQFFAPLLPCLTPTARALTLFLDRKRHFVTQTNSWNLIHHRFQSLANQYRKLSYGKLQKERRRKEAAKKVAESVSYVAYSNALPSLSHFALNQFEHCECTQNHPETLPYERYLQEKHGRSNWIINLVSFWHCVVFWRRRRRRQLDAIHSIRRAKFFIRLHEQTTAN